MNSLAGIGWYLLASHPTAAINLVDEYALS